LTKFIAASLTRHAISGEQMRSCSRVSNVGWLRSRPPDSALRPICNLLRENAAFPRLVCTVQILGCNPSLARRTARRAARMLSVACLGQPAAGVPVTLGPAARKRNPNNGAAR